MGKQNTMSLKFQMKYQSIEDYLFNIFRSKVNWSNVIMMLILHWLSIGLNTPLKC